MGSKHYSKRWLYIPQLEQDERRGNVPLSDEKIKHLRKVLRLEWGTQVYVTNGQGRLYDGTFEQGGFISLQKLLKEEKSPPFLELVIGLSKNTTMDWIIEKATECGVTHITPVVTSRSIVHPKKDEISKYKNRWNLIASAALEQSERLWMPTIETPHSWVDFLERSTGHKPDSGKYVFLSELRQSTTSDYKTCLDQMNQKRDSLLIMIGPEGGFTEQEQKELKERSFVPLCLGRYVLRVETAVIVAVTLAKATQG